MGHAICQRMNIEPSKVMVVGDTIADLKRRAPQSGISSRRLSFQCKTRPFADVLLEFRRIVGHHQRTKSAKMKQATLFRTQPEILSKPRKFDSKEHPHFSTGMFYFNNLTDPAPRLRPNPQTFHGVIAIEISLPMWRLVVDIVHGTFRPVTTLCTRHIQPPPRRDMGRLPQSQTRSDRIVIPRFQQSGVSGLPAQTV